MPVVILSADPDRRRSAQAAAAPHRPPRRARRRRSHALGATIPIAWTSASPASCVLISATTPPTRVMPSQIAMYSGQLRITRQTTSPGPMPWRSAQPAYRSDPLREARHRSGFPARRSAPALSGNSAAMWSMATGRVTVGSCAIEAVACKARIHASRASLSVSMIASGTAVSGFMGAPGPGEPWQHSLTQSSIHAMNAVDGSARTKSGATADRCYRRKPSPRGPHRG